MKFHKLFIVLFVSIIATGCMSMQTPPYEPSINNYEKLQGGAYGKVVVDDFAVAKPELNQISVRGSALNSSLNDSFGTYLKSALEEEFYKAGLLAKDSKCVISGTILENDIETGMSVGSGHISANIIIKDDGNTVFDKTLTATHTWQSSFVGAVAIPRARDNYPFVVREFINKLFEDEDFKKAITMAGS